MTAVPISVTPDIRDDRWQWRHLMRAPHRLAFAAAIVTLMLTSIWWALTLSAQLGWLPAWPLKVWPSMAHGTMMTYSFFALFFVGFLSTAGPRWLGVQPPSSQKTVLPISLQLGGWMLWVFGTFVEQRVMLVGGVVSLIGLAWSYQQFGSLLARSQAKDRVHPRVIFFAGLVGVISLTVLLLTWGLGHYQVARAAVFTGFWGFVAPTFVTVAHRMIPFFTSGAVPMVAVWRPYWVLYFLLSALAMALAPSWLEAASIKSSLAEVTISFWLLVSAIIVLWLALIWGLLRAISNKLLVMLHIGFIWLGISFFLLAIGHLWSWSSGTLNWPLGAFHASSMGFMGSMTMAMVSRVSSGHSGRPLNADRFMWSLFLLMQLIVCLRITTQWSSHIWATFSMTAVSIVWCVIFVLWGVRLLRWYGKPRIDGQPG